MTELTKEMKISDILDSKPAAAGILMKYGIHCVGCMAANFESLEQGAQAHGLDDETINKIVEEINALQEDGEEPVEESEDNSSEENEDSE